MPNQRAEIDGSENMSSRISPGVYMTEGKKNAQIVQI